MYGAVAAAAAAFAGLLLVALTVNLSRVLPDAGHLARAREALAGLLSLLVMALLVLIPGQPRGALGLELLGLAAVLVVQHRVPGADDAPPAAPAAGSLGGADAAGQRGHGHDDRGRCLPIAGAGGGLYWLAATVVVYVLRSALEAWDLLIQAAGTPPA
jgi:hypothetical protein